MSLHELWISGLDRHCHVFDHRVDALALVSWRRSKLGLEAFGEGLSLLSQFEGRILGTHASAFVLARLFCDYTSIHLDHSRRGP